MGRAVGVLYAECMAFPFPRVYPILDSSRIPTVDRAAFLCRLGASLVGAGVTLLEYRNKQGSDAELRADAAVLRAAMPAGQVKLILDDRADLVAAVGFDGVHVDAGDVSPADARCIVGPARIVGAFGGGDALLPGILAQPVDYLAIGPVFTTTTKQTSASSIGVEGVRRLRAQAGPDVVLTAAAGITLAAAPAVLAAGATAVAVSAALFSVADPAAEFRRWLHALGG
ncbi:MAG TPA: thiamine phosphate synthase [Terracidiphilus sp.]|nr:thiamine phosphate synthase [Terracidiphilus sp.]